MSTIILIYLLLYEELTLSSFIWGTFFDLKQQQQQQQLKF